jgi:hypothetical protein
MSTTYEITTIDTHRDEEHYHEVTYPDRMPSPENQQTATFGRAWEPGELEVNEGWEIVVTDGTGTQLSGWVNTVEREGCRITKILVEIYWATNDASEEHGSFYPGQKP